LCGEYPCYKIYKTKDGYVSLGAMEFHFWKNFCVAINRLELIDKQFVYGGSAQEVIDSLEKLFMTRTKQEWFDFFKDKEVCLTPVNNLEEAINDPQIVHRELITEIKKIKQINLPIKFNGLSNNISEKAPSLGEHTEQILKQLGYSL
jgi:crotonobetainyl-CoA:carnitine CoA-transferase CaiB-like acyl-CoA transferase